METRTFTILGEMGSGKTCYLLGMYRKLNAGLDGYTIAMQDTELNSELMRSFRSLKDTSLPKGERFPYATNETQKYLFDLCYASKTIMPLKWMDYPGGLLNNPSYDGYPEVAKSINESSTLFICVDGELLVGDDTNEKIENVQDNCSMSINPFFNRYFKENGKLPPVGIILTKADLFRHDTDDAEIRKILVAAFSLLFASRDTSIGVIPVTLGENIKDNNYRGRLRPVNTHLPIFMGIWNALNDSIIEYETKLSANRNSISYLEGRIRDARREIESANSTISRNTAERDRLDGKWFSSFRFGSEIDALQRAIDRAKEKKRSADTIIDDSRDIISNKKDEAKKIQDIRDAVNRDSEKFQEYINQIMWFRNGQWTI